MLEILCDTDIAWT